MAAPDRIPQIDPARSVRLAGDGDLLLDVREPDEWAAANLPVIGDDGQPGTVA